MNDEMSTWLMCIVAVIPIVLCMCVWCVEPSGYSVYAYILYNIIDMHNHVIKFESSCCGI